MRWMVRERGFVSIVAIVGSGTRDGRILARDWDLGVVVGGGDCCFVKGSFRVFVRAECKDYQLYIL